MSQNFSKITPAQNSRAAQALEALLPKLQGVLSEENRVLESQIPGDHESYIVKKNQLLRELMTVQRMEGMTELSPEMRVQVAELRVLVGQNHRYLAAQVAAMKEITSMLTAVALAEDADGTYSRRQ
jgi:hypothetical protein